MTFENRYGFVDRLLHRLAFSTRLAQVAIADMEDRLARRELERVPDAPPVLITGLPRAGTTILLEMLAAAPSFASHTYRDMPFVLCPIAWQLVSGGFRREGHRRARAHDDGIEISADSPEAFEEVLWMRFWPRHYGAASITPWDSCRNEEFAEFLQRHMRKIVALRRRVKPTARRYVSKNNVTLARVPAIWEVLPNAIVVTPFREPLQHAASLLRQHLRFTELHARDPFAKRYMSAIGHFDFGANLKPIDFDGWLGRLDTRDTGKLQFWLAYWIATHRHVLGHARRGRMVPLCFEGLRPEVDLSRLARALELDDDAELASQRSRLRAPKPHEIDPAGFSAATAAEAAAVYEDLRALSVV